jgi:hypothetical protein
VLIFEHYLAHKLFSAVREAFSNAYPGREVLDKIAHRLVTKLLDMKCLYVFDKDVGIFSIFCEAVFVSYFNK